LLALLAATKEEKCADKEEGGNHANDDSNDSACSETGICFVGWLW
jgi:hypothetical protein